MSLNYTDKDTKILIDYVSFTVKVWDLLTELKPEDFEVEEFNFFPDERKLSEMIIEKFRLGDNEIEFHMQRARQGYLFLYICNGISFAFGGCNTVLVQMSGTGCRYFETLNPGLTWYSYFWSTKAEFSTFHLTRLDVACDTFGLLNMDTIIKYSYEKRFVSIWRKGKIKQGILDDHEKTVIFGSSKSNFLLRIYDKTAERLENISSDIAVPDGWVRCEYQFRDERAGAFLQSWLQCQDIGKIYYGVMYDYLKFYNNYDGVHSDRIVLTKWWKKFLGNAQRIKITYEGGLEYNLEQLQRYVFKQAGSSIKTLLTVNEGDLSSFLNAINSCKLNTRQEQLITLIHSCESSPLNNYKQSDTITAEQNAVEILRILKEGKSSDTQKAIK